MLFFLKLQRDSRKNALSVEPAEGKTGKKAVFSPHCGDETSVYSNRAKNKASTISYGTAMREHCTSQMLWRGHSFLISSLRRVPAGLFRRSAQTSPTPTHESYPGDRRRSHRRFPRLPTGRRYGPRGWGCRTMCSGCSRYGYSASGGRWGASGGALPCGIRDRG